MATTKTNQKSSDIEKYLRDLLECPVCLETIKSVPVYQCTNGHVICKDCIKELDNCPICRNNSAPARNLQLEKIVQRLEGIQHEKRSSTTATPNLQKWGKGSVRSYGTINRPNQESHIEIIEIPQAAIRAIRQPSIRQPVASQPSINGPNQVTSIEINSQTNPRQATPRQASTRQATLRQATPRQATPRQATPRQATPRQATPSQALTRQARREARRESRIVINNQDVRSVMYPIINGPNQEINLQSNPGQATIRQAMPRQATPWQAEIDPMIACIVTIVIVLIFAALIVFCICVMFSPEFCNCS